ncbi:methylation protein EvaC [Micromonospora pisi]|uniref:Methylation protein EvaC n=1 Tax=Micromonospora pisi TaxID=589240 RepID=A0A495JFP8_9ACTN|nr:class I SAM-dependent methyltransferase [Micromonospora pisi]RKR86889.1 methylation protein EvaC [Micromonospora pisi]
MKANSSKETCRICGGIVRQWFDFGPQPISNAFLRHTEVADEIRYDLVVGICGDCTMVQQQNECPRDRMFRPDYPYRASGSVMMRKHFEQVAETFLMTELAGPDPFIVEIGSNDGVMLRTIRTAGVRHLGVDPSVDAVEVAAAEGVRVRVDFFEESSATSIRAAEGPADVIYSANTISHIAYIDSILRGVATLLAPSGVFVFEDRYLGDIVEHSCFDQLYDEHFYLFAVRSVQAMVARFGLELVDVEHLAVHGGSIRYTVTLAGARTPSTAVRDMLEQERKQGLAEMETYERFAERITAIRHDLRTLLERLRSEGRRVVGYGATSKSATVTSYCGIGPNLVPFVCDSTPEKQGRLSPGSRIPVRPQEAFSDPYPDYALLFAWNHAEEIMAKEREFSEQGGRWILYVPTVHVV